MNLYKFHTIPQQLMGFDQADKCVPYMFWAKYQNDDKQLQKREIATDPYYSFTYARENLKAPFPLGEPAILRDIIYGTDCMAFIEAIP